MRSAQLQKLELEAYTAVLRALAATAMDWVSDYMCLGGLPLLGC